MYKKIPEPKTALATPEYVISDHTAALKARRLMTELKEHASAENWARTNTQLRVKKGISNTRRWRRTLQMPRTRDDILGAWVDGNGEFMRRPDPKKTAEVIIWILAAGATSGKINSAPDAELYLAWISFKRSEVLHPEKVGHKVGPANTMLRITLHAIQRMIQRGYGLTDKGEISYIVLLDCLLMVWQKGRRLLDQETSFPAEYRVSAAK